MNISAQRAADCVSVAFLRFFGLHLGFVSHCFLTASIDFLTASSRLQCVTSTASRPLRLFAVMNFIVVICSNSRLFLACSFALSLCSLSVQRLVSRSSFLIPPYIPLYRLVDIGDTNTDAQGFLCLCCPRRFSFLLKLLEK